MVRSPAQPNHRTLVLVQVLVLVLAPHVQARLGQYQAALASWRTQRCLALAQARRNAGAGKGARAQVCMLGVRLWCMAWRSVSQRTRRTSMQHVQYWLQRQDWPSGSCPEWG